MRQQVTIYLSDELAERFKREAERMGISISAYVTRQLTTAPNQWEQLQLWLCHRFDRLDAALSLHAAKISAD